MANRFDWQNAYARQEKVRVALEAGGELPPDEVRRILRERAQALARPREEAPTPTEVVELLVFSLAGERYGVETAHVQEVIPLRGLTPVPRTPAFVLGVVNHRGWILPVLDLRRLFELTGQGVTEGSPVIVAGAGGMRYGILTEAVEGMARVGAQEVAPPPVTLTGDRPAFIRGVTSEMVAVLDPDALARDPRIIVNEE